MMYQHALHTTPDLAATRLLLVDDSRAMRGVLTTLLRGLGLGDVYATGNADEAIVLANTCRPDIALIDYDLDGEAGLDLVRQMRDPRLNPHPDLPLLLLAPVNLPHLMAGARQAGASAILPKPLNANTLEASLTTVIAAGCQQAARSGPYHAYQ
ncbi:MAG: response regulator [Alphaproteobacteria bacterium]|nr:response regulator [Alphaproteobacteria bacterium]